MAITRSDGDHLTKNTHSGKFLPILVFLAASFLFFAGLGDYPFLDPDEGRYAEIPREMIESGDYVTPRLNYVKYYEKPPLFYWITAGSMLLFGRNELAVRAVPAIAGCLTVLLIMAFGRRLFGGTAGPVAGWIYATSLLPAVMARLPVIDGVFSLFLFAAWAAWWLGYDALSERARKRWYLAAWGCMGLAVMTKGIAAIALTGAIVFPFILLRRDWRALKIMAWMPGILLFVVIVAPWHIAAALRDPQFLHFYIIVQHFHRLSFQEHASPFWFFPAILPFGLLLWTAVFFPAAINAVRQALRKDKESPIILFLMIWIAGVTGLFSMSSGKLIPYILPAYPAMALLVSHYLARGGLEKLSTRWCSAVTAGLLLAAIPVVLHFARMQDTMPPEAAKAPLLAGLCGLGIGSALLILAVFKRRFMPLATGLAIVALFPAVILAVPAVANHRKIGGFIKAMPSPLPVEINIAEWRNYDQSLSFYAERRIILIDEIGELAFGKSLEEPSGFFLTGEESLKRLAGEGPFLVNLRPHAWPSVKQWGLLHPVAANTTNVMAGNDAFFQVTGLAPWPNDAVVQGPLLLMPKKAPAFEKAGPAPNP